MYSVCLCRRVEEEEEEEEEQVVEWAYTQSGLLQGRGGQVLMGSPELPVSARI